MAENIVINIEANTEGLEKTIDLLVKLGQVQKADADAFKKYSQDTAASIGKTVTSTTKEFEKMGTVLKSIKNDNVVSKALGDTKDIAKVSNAFGEMKRSLKDAKDELASAIKQFGRTSEEARNAAAKVEGLKGDIDDLNDSIKALDPANKFKTVQTLGAAIGGAFQVATGALQAFGTENEKVTKIAQQFQGAINIAGGISQLSDLKKQFQDVALALGIVTKAKEVDAVASEAGAVANKTFATSLSATGIGAIVVALGALAGIFIEMANNAEESAKSTKRLKEETNKLAEARKGLRDAINEEQDAELALKVTRGEITQGEMDRIILQRKSLEEYKKNSFEVASIDIKLKRAKEQLTEAQKQYDAANAISQNSGAAQLFKKQVDSIQALVDVLQKQYDVAINKRTATDDAYRAKFTDSKEKEAQAFKKSEEDKTKTLKDETAKRKNVDKIEPITPVTKNLTADINKQVKDLNDSTKQGTEMDGVINPILVPTRAPLPPIEGDLGKAMKQQAAAAEKLKELKDQLNKEIVDGAIKTAEEWAAVWIDAQLQVDQQNIDSIDQQQKDLEESYKNRTINRLEYDQKEQDLNLKKAQAEKKLKHDQDIANRNKSLFDIAINTAVSITKTLAELGFVAGGPLIPWILGLGAAQAATVLAAPLPKYKRGTLSVPGVGNEDTQLAMLTPGEAVIPKDTNARYKDAVAAIYNNKVSPDDLNGFVRMKLKGDYSKTSGGPVVAKMETSDLYALGKMIRKNDGVYVKNMGEFASIFASLNNPRR